MVPAPSDVKGQGEGSRAERCPGRESISIKQVVHGVYKETGVPRER